MIRSLLTINILAIALAVVAQSPAERLAVPQCSAIREVIFSAFEKQFDNLMLEANKGSYGRQVRGSWRFETVQYQSLLSWPTATRSYIDNSEEQTDSTFHLIRQFVAEYAGLPTLEAARNKFETLNQQIADCRLLLSDTSISVLRPLPLDKIQDELPVAAIDAWLYPIKVKDATAASPGQEVVIMTAYEKIGRYYGAYMIVEYRLQQQFMYEEQD